MCGSRSALQTPALVFVNKEKIKITLLAFGIVKDILIHHRTGALQINEVAVIIVVAAPHRQAAFEACRYAIDTLKKPFLSGKKKCLWMVRNGCLHIREGAGY